MRVIELHGDLVGEIVPTIAFDPLVATDHVLQRTGHEEILLNQAQFFAVLGFVVRIKHLRNRFAVRFLTNRFDVTAFVERFEIELFFSVGCPEAQ